MTSIWKATSQLNTSGQSLKHDCITDVLVIGGGLAGVLCAYNLQQQGVSCILVEKHQIGASNTGNTTAKITAQHGYIYHDLINKMGPEKARQYYDINTMALREYRYLAKTIDCDFQEQTAYIYARNNPGKLMKEQQAYERLKIRYEHLPHTRLPFKTEGALGLPRQAQFHPLKLIAALLPKINYYENTFVTEVNDRTVRTSSGHRITAEHIVLATHFPMVNVPGLYFMKMNQSRSYVLALEQAPAPEGMYIDVEAEGYSFRKYDNMLLLGGGGSKTGTDRGGYRQLRDFARKYYPEATERYAWSAQDCMSLDSVPYIGRHRRKTTNLYVATGFNKWGMTGAMSAALVLTDLITTGRSRYRQLFSPQRSMLQPKLFANMLSSTLHLVTPGKRCTHLGCRLQWNPQERTWECPCHGSRYAESGRVLDNPAKKGL